MLFLCVGYFDARRMNTRPKHEIDAVMAQCSTHLQGLYATGRVICDVGVLQEGKNLLRVNAKLTVADIPADEPKEMIGGFTLIEARDMNEAIQLAAMHPATQVLAGEQFGWRTEIRPVYSFKSPGGRPEPGTGKA